MGQCHKDLGLNAVCPAGSSHVWVPHVKVILAAQAISFWISFPF